MITQDVCTAYKLDCQDGVHQPSDDYRIALYTSSADLNAGTNAYTTAGEVIGAGYVAGGMTLANRASGRTLSGIAWVTFDDPVWPNSTITAAGAMIYNASKSDRSLAVVTFAVVTASTSGPFTVYFPPTGSTAAIRIE